MLRQAAALPPGRIIDDVRCIADPSQGYCLYVPSRYSTDRTWPVLFLFDPGGVGRNGVERYQGAAEQYGYLLASSNTSRNGQASTPVVATMSGDVAARFRIEPRRMYTGGMSGGARVAIGIALGSGRVAGVIACGAGYPDGQLRQTLPFPLFTVAGTEDYNLQELRRIDRELTTAHRLELFDGGHEWLPAAVAGNAIEWLELQAMRTALAPRDNEQIDRFFTKRVPPAGAARELGTLRLLQWAVMDFQGLKDVSALAARAADLEREPGIQAALLEERNDEERERQLLAAVWTDEERLEKPFERDAALMALRRHWEELAAQAGVAPDSTERRRARRVLGQLSANALTNDDAYLRIIREFRGRF